MEEEKGEKRTKQEQKGKKRKQEKQSLEETKKTQLETEDRSGHTYNLRYKCYSSNRFGVKNTQPD